MAKFAVYLEPYRLDAGHVGEDIFQPILVSRHRSPLAARRALVRCITGTNSIAKNYLRDMRRSGGVPIALRYLAYQIAESGRIERKLSANELKGI